MSYNQGFITDVLHAYQIKLTGKLPVDGAPATYVRFQKWNVRVWIDPLPPRTSTGRQHKRSTHRVMCECPRCGAQLSAGRLEQHIGTSTCDSGSGFTVTPEQRTTNDRAFSELAQAAADMVRDRLSQPLTVTMTRREFAIWQGLVSAALACLCEDPHAAAQLLSLSDRRIEAYGGADAFNGLQQRIMDQLREQWPDVGITVHGNIEGLH